LPSGSILSDARFALAAELAGAHYHGTYFAASVAANGLSGPTDDGSAGSETQCQTLWGVSRREAMDQLFDLGRERIARKTIVDTDVAEFLTGLPDFVRPAMP
jgi:hypothetical protein